VGWNYAGTVTQCYSTGTVSGRNSVGGLVGTDSGTVQCFWDIKTSGQAKSAGGTGLTTAEMQRASTFFGWCGPVWTIAEGQGYPHLAWENVPGEAIAAGPTYGGGTGTAQDPYLIYTAEELNTVGGAVCDWDKHFKLMADINLSTLDGKKGRPAFNIIAPGRGYAFTGVFDGNGHTISHLTIEGLGLFGRLGSGAEVKDLGVVDVNITGGEPVGGLVGWNDGSVTSCYSTGAVSGFVGVGGLVGQNDGVVTQCYSTGTVSGPFKSEGVGGLVGQNDGVVTQCYSTGAVSGTWGVGGLVAINSGQVTQCYSTGAVSGGGSVGGLVGEDCCGGTVTQCFWDIETSGQAKSAGGTGLTTDQMQHADPFLAAGWPFGDGTRNGAADTWWINEGKDYPRLVWARTWLREAFFPSPPDGAIDVCQMCTSAQIRIQWPRQRRPVVASTAVDRHSM